MPLALSLEAVNLEFLRVGCAAPDRFELRGETFDLRRRDFYGSRRCRRDLRTLTVDGEDERADQQEMQQRFPEDAGEKGGRSTGSVGI